MKAINNHNIDEWLFDYFEGNLSDAENKRLIGYLNQHPELQADYDAWKNSYVQEPEIIYPKAASLLHKNAIGKRWVKWILSGVLLLILSVIIFYQPTTKSPVAKSKVSEKRVIAPAQPGVKLPENKAAAPRFVNHSAIKENNEKTSVEREKDLYTNTEINTLNNLVDTLEEKIQDVTETLPVVGNIPPEKNSIKEIQIIDTVSQVTNGPIESPPEKEKKKKMKRNKEMNIIKLRELGF